MPKIGEIGRKSSNEPPDFTKLFECLGVDFTGDCGDQRIADCPDCGKSSKFYMKPTTGQYDCKVCGVSGNHWAFLRRYYDAALEATTAAQYQTLKKKRGLSLQTLKRFGLAWDAREDCWLIPAKSQKGEVVNLLRYWLDGRELAKLLLPDLPQCLFGLDQFSDKADRKVLICEGPLDLLALDQHLRERKTRGRYDLLAVTSCSGFKSQWASFLKERDVRFLLDNDKGGRDGQDRAAKIIREANVGATVSVLHWPAEFRDKFDIGDLIRERPDIPVIKFTEENCHEVSDANTAISFTCGSDIAPAKVEWFWPVHMQFKTIADFSGEMGTQKSTIAKCLVARATAGRPMPGCTVGLPPCNALYLTSEDSAAQVHDIVKAHGGDLSRLHVYDANERGPLNLLDPGKLKALEAEIRRHKAKVVVIDALNTFVCGDINTDAKARRNVSGPLQALARRTGAVIIVIRNLGRSADDTPASKRALGAISVAHVARAVMNTREQREPVNGERQFELVFEKVSDAPQPKPIPFRVEDLSTGPEDSHLRRIVWGPRPALPAAKKVAQKGSATGASHSAAVPRRVG